MKINKKKGFIKEPNTTYIYGIRWLGSNVYIYIGQTMKNPEIRLKEHIRRQTNLYMKNVVSKTTPTKYLVVDILDKIKQRRGEGVDSFKKRVFNTEKAYIVVYKTYKKGNKKL